MSTALIIGAGPAGLMAAEHLARAGVRVDICDQMPSPARKFLMAGKSGLNITRAEPIDDFLAAYDRDDIRRIVADFGPEQVRIWAEGLGQDMFTGSTGRVFPVGMKASPLLRAWLARLDALGVVLHRRTRWIGWDGDACLFEGPDGPVTRQADVTVFALGGGSWRRLGSDGAWTDRFAGVRPFQPSNVGLRVAWSHHMARHFGTPIKGVALGAGALRSRGEVVLTRDGIEGGGIYALSPALRAGAPLVIDMVPDLDTAALRARLSGGRAKDSQANLLRKALRWPPGKIALVQELLRPWPADPAPALKALTCPHDGVQDMDQAISTAGGLGFDQLTEGLMLRDRPGVFCAGEMLDWDAPTGGYLLTACLASGRHAGRAAVDYIKANVR